MRALALLALLALTGTAFAGGVNNPGGGGSGSVTCGTNITGCPSGPLATIYPINAQTGASYTINTTDAGKLITLNNAGAVSVPLANAATAGFGANFAFDIQNQGAGTATITPSVSTIGGAGSLVLTTGQWCTVISDGTNYQIPFCSNTLAPTASPTFTGTVSAAGVTQTGIYTNSTAGALSSGAGPAFNITGAAITGGTATTNVPLIYINQGATPPATWSTTGTYLGFNGVAAFSGNFMDVHLNGGSSIFKISNAGQITATGGAVLSNTITLNNNVNSNTSINTGTSTGTITIGNSGTTGTLTLASLATNAAANAVCILGTNVVTTANVAACSGVSSKFFKHDIKPIPSVVERVMMLKPSSWRYNKGTADSGKSVQYGLIAEDIAKAFPKADFPDLTIYQKGKLISYSWQGFDTGILTKAIQEQQAEIAHQEAEIKLLQKEVALLEHRK